MPISNRPHEPQQEMRLPASLQDGLPKGRLAYFISDTTLKVIAEARERLAQRQRDADIERGRSEDVECKPRHEGGSPMGGRYQREGCT
jgi:hypothetical protein